MNPHGGVLCAVSMNELRQKVGCCPAEASDGQCAGLSLCGQPTDGILSDFGGIVAAERPDLFTRSSFVSGTPQDRGERNGPYTWFGYSFDSGYRRADT